MKQLTFEQIQKNFNTDYQFSQVTRERAAADMSFFWITHWDGALLSDCSLDYKGEFDLLRKAFRDIMSDMRSNPIMADFEPIAGTSDESAELLDGIYRACSRKNTSREAFDYACIEQVIGGLGGWRLYTKYESDGVGNLNQVIERAPIHEYNNCVFFDSNAKRIDKSDATRCTVLTPFSPDGYAAWFEEMTGEGIDPASVMDSFSQPENGWSFPWADVGGASEIIYVGEYYHAYKTKVRIQLFTDQFGTMQAFEQEKGKKAGEVDEELLAAGFELVGEKEIEKNVCDKYYVTGSGIIGKPKRVAGGLIPIIPQYGDRAYIQGVEHYEGIVKAAKDPQMLRDFTMSYLASIVGQSPRVKPIYFPEQVQGFEHMHEETGADSAYPYLLVNRFDANGNELPGGPVGQSLEQPVPTSLQQLMAEMRMAVEDVANPGLPNNIADTDLSGKAINQLAGMFDQQSMGFQENRKYAIRRDAEVYAAMAAETYDAPRKVTTMSADGNREEVELMTQVLDIDSGEIKVLNDLTQAKFEVYADIGKAYDTSKQQSMEKLEMMLPQAAALDPQLAKIIQLKMLRLTDGAEMQDLREWAGVQLVLMGIRQPETEQEEQALQQAQEAQSQQQDPNMALAMAEQAKAQNGAVANEIKMFQAETDRLYLQVDAEKAGADIDYKKIQGNSMRVNDAMKLRQSVNQPQ
jgi:hypothetical protein